MAKLGKVENFLKFKHEAQFGVISCLKSNISYLPNKTGDLGSLCMVGFAEDVIIWDMNTKKTIDIISGRNDDSVTFLTYFRDITGDTTIVIGYESGYVSGFKSEYSMQNSKMLFSNKCHKHPITCIMHCDGDDSRIICGSKDTEISVLNVLDGQGYRLKGHTSPITKLQYISQRDILISSSQDGSIKFWFLSQKHCFKTIFNNSDVWDFIYVDRVNLLITASSDPMLRIWKLSFIEQRSDDLNEDVVDQLSNSLQATFLGNVDRASPKRVQEMVVDKSQTYIAFNTGEKRVEIFKLLNAEEIVNRQKKKEKKAKKLNLTPEDVTITADDRLRKYSEIFLPFPCKSMSMIFNQNLSTLEILTSLKNNTVAIMELATVTQELKVKKHVTTPGHRTAVIYSQFTSEGNGFLTVSLSEAKLWSKDGLKVLSTIEWPRRKMHKGDIEEEEMEHAEIDLAPGQKLEANTAVLLPGDRYAAIGYKVGLIIVYSLLNGEMIQFINAHQESVTSLVMSADRTRLISSSTDKTLRLWKVEYGVLNGGAKGKLQLSDTGITQQYAHGISRVNVTSDNKMVLVAFLNSKVQSCSYKDLGKRVLDFYKHSQPVSCIDVKYDNSEMLTGSGDKTVIKWSLQFADCSIFKGHKEAITDVKYIPGRSMAFSSDKSGLIIQINLKNMTEIMRLKSHGAQITSLSILADGTEKDDEELGGAQMLSVSTDYSIRFWFESDEILSREVEEEEERDRRYEQEDLAREEMIVVGAPQVRDTGLLTKKTLNTEHAADELIEALDNCRALQEDPAAKPDPRMAACGYTDADMYFLFVLNKVQRGDLEVVLAQLPMPYVELFLEVGAKAVQNNWETTLLLRCFHFLDSVHFKTMKANKRVAPLLSVISRYCDLAMVQEERSTGFINAAGEGFGGMMGPSTPKFDQERSKKKPKNKKK